MAKHTRKTSRTKKQQSPAEAASTQPNRSPLLRSGFVILNAVFFVIFVAGLSINTLAMVGGTHPNTDLTVRDSRMHEEFRRVTKEVAQLAARQEQDNLTVVQPVELEQQLSIIQIDIQSGAHNRARFELGQLQQRIDNANAKLAQESSIKRSAAAKETPRQGSNIIPILMYHYTPSNFNSQLTILEQRGYHTVTMQQIAAALQGGAGLPAKPVAITFDDGFANQMEAFQLLQKHHMVATYYIISAGQRSRWCIGAGRRYGDPLQPAGGCGDAYLSWDQIGELDRSGTVIIGGHTVDHENLAGESAADQQFEVAQNKQDIESRLGHPIRDFAYPYGAFSATTISIVKAAGYTTAVTTLPGVSQAAGGLFTLHRVRDALQLP